MSHRPHDHHGAVDTPHHHGELVRMPLTDYLYDGVDPAGFFRLTNVNMLADFDQLPVTVKGVDGITAAPIARSRELTGQPHPETGTTDSAVLGVDMLYVPPGNSFPPHVHPGHHLLMSVKGKGSITYGDEEISVRQGDLYFILADLPHAVGSEADGPGHWLLSFGAPHKRVEADDRMRLLDAVELMADPTPGGMGRLERLLRRLHVSA